MEDEQRPAWTYDIGAFLRAKVRPVIALDEPTVQRLTGVCAALYDLEWRFEQVSAWALWLAKRVASNPSVKSPAAVYVKEIEKGSPKEMPTAPKRVDPEGHSADPSYRQKQQENRERVDDQYGDTSPPFSLCLPLGRALRKADPQNPDPFREAQLVLDKAWRDQGKPPFYKFDATGLKLDPHVLAEFEAGQAEASAHFERHNKETT